MFDEIKSRRTFASNPLLLSLDQQIQPGEKQRIPGEYAMEKPGHKEELGKGVEGRGRGRGRGNKEGKVLTT